MSFYFFSHPSVYGVGIFFSFTSRDKNTNFSSRRHTCFGYAMCMLLEQTQDWDILDWEHNMSTLRLSLMFSTYLRYLDVLYV